MASVLALIHDEEGAYVISFPDFPGCVSGGSSLAEAQFRGAAALQVHVDIMRAEGDPISRPRSYIELLEDETFRLAEVGAVVSAVDVNLGDDVLHA